MKVSKIILGTMQYGDKGWQGWVLPEEEGIKHIKYASVSSPLYYLALRSITSIDDRYDAGIQTFDTANVSDSEFATSILRTLSQVYSNGLSEVILGKAIKQHNLPRDEIVIMTKVGIRCEQSVSSHVLTSCYPQVYFPVAKTYGLNTFAFGKTPEELGLVNQNGLSRKVLCSIAETFLSILIIQQHIFDSVKHSLERLQVDYIDLLQCQNQEFLLIIS